MCVPLECNTTPGSTYSSRSVGCRVSGATPVGALALFAGVVGRLIIRVMDSLQSFSIFILAMPFVATGQW